MCIKSFCFHCNQEIPCAKRCTKFEMKYIEEMFKSDTNQVIDDRKTFIKFDNQLGTLTYE